MTRRSPAAAPTAAALAPFAPPAAAVAAMAGFAAWQAAAPAAAETGYLALLAGALLLCLGGLAGATAGGRKLVAVASTLAVVAVWALPPGPTRGAAVVAFLVAALALAFAGRAAAGPAGARARGSAPGGWRFAEALAILVPAAVALQVLALSDRLLAVELTPRLAAGLLGLPIVAAAAIAWLGVRRGRDAALLAAAAAVLVSGAGIGAAAAGGLAALALAELAWSLRARRREPSAPDAGTAGGLALGGLGASLRSSRHGEPPRPGAPGPGREAIAWLALAAVFAALALGDPRTAALAAGAAALLAPSARVRGAAGAAALLAAFLWPAAGWEAAGGRAALAVVVLPALAWTALPPRTARRVLTETLPALVLLAAAARCGASPAAMAAPLALLALLAARPAPLAATPGPALAPQRVWSGVLVSLSALIAAFPWLREAPVHDALALFGLRPGAGEAAVAVAVALGFGLAARPAARVGERPARRPLRLRPAAWAARPAAWTAGLLALAAVAALPAGPATPFLADGEVTLDASRPELVVSLDGTAGGSGPAVGSLVIDSNLSHAAVLPDRQPVATVRLLDSDGSAEEWTLLAGRDTAEWAVRRPDVAAGAAHAPPEAWLASVAPEGGFFGQVYRSRRRAERPLAASRLEIRLAPGLPPDTVLHLYRVEARP